MKMRVFAIGAFAFFSFVAAGTVMAQERQVLQEGYTGGGTGKIGSGPGGGVDNVYIHALGSQPETNYGRLWGKDVPGGKIYVETGGGALVTLRLNEKTNAEELKDVGVGNDVEIQAYRNKRVLGSGAFASEVPEGDAFMLSISVIRKSDNPTNLVPQAGYNPDTDRAIYSRDGSTLGGVGGQCFQCYEGSVPDYK